MEEKTSATAGRKGSSRTAREGDRGPKECRSQRARYISVVSRGIRNSGGQTESAKLLRGGKCVAEGVYWRGEGERLTMWEMIQEKTNRRRQPKEKGLKERAISKQAMGV